MMSFAFKLMDFVLKMMTFWVNISLNVVLETPTTTDIQQNLRFLLKNFHFLSVGPISRILLIDLYTLRNRPKYREWYTHLLRFGGRPTGSTLRRLASMLIDVMLAAVGPTQAGSLQVNNV